MAGALVALGNASGVRFDSATTYMLGNAGMYAAGGGTLAVVARMNVGNTKGIGGEYSSTSANPMYEFAYAAGATIDTFIRATSGTTVKTASNGGLPFPLPTAAPGQFVITDTGTALKRRFMKVTQADVAYSRTEAVALDQFALGARVRTTSSEFFDGDIGEVLQVYSALPDDKRLLIENSQVSAFGVVV